MQEEGHHDQSTDTKARRQPGQPRSQGWLGPAPACRAVAAYGRAVAQQVAAGRGANKFWSGVAPAGAMAVQAV